VIGQTISHYRILGKLGEGGMGVVYKAEDTMLRRIVALKFLPRNLTGNAVEQARFAQEAQAAATINHPNVCTIYRIGEHDGQQFIEMEYVDGSTLKHLCPVPDPRAWLRYAVQIADALREAHDRGIIHRDIKSDNIMVNAAGQVKVMDFGLAKLRGESRLTRTSSTVGTVAYMSPEQIQGAEVDHRSDQFSLGIVLFEMLTGKRPFRGEHEAAMMYSIVNEEPSLSAGGTAGVPDGVLGVIRRLLAKDPNDRYARTGDLVEELKGIDQGSGSTGVRKPSDRTSTLPGKKRPAFLPVAAAAAILAISVIAYFLWNPFGGNDRIDSIAVLPFQNAGGDPATEYLSDGIAEHVINALSQLKMLRVIPRSTAFHYKGKDSDARAVGEELKVRAVLTGRVIQQGDNLNVQVELIDVGRQSQLWGQQYIRKISDLLSVQEEIERSIATELHLTGDESRVIAKRATENSDAYQLYLRGRYYWDKRSVAGFGKALQYFQQALDLDPNYALAYTGVADCYDLLGLGIYNGLPPGESFPKAKFAIDKAFRLDSSLGEAYTTRGHMNHSYEWDWERAGRDFRRAIELSPKYGTGHVFYAVYLNAMGNRDEAKQHFLAAQQLEPLSLPINTWLGMEYYYSREFDKSIEQIKKSIDIDANFANAHLMLGWPYLAKGLTGEAVREFGVARDLAGDNPVAVAALIYALGRDGRRDEARSLMDTLLAAAKARYVSPHNLAIAYLGVGDTAKFYQELDRTVDERAFIVSVGVLRVDPFFDFARNDPRFRATFAKTDLPGLDGKP
jgi:TolB-like protein/Flp pilus assembly protein TadD/predicted Ser/Thr protein kinase